MEKYTDLKNKRINLIDRVPLKMPFTLFIDPTNCCNFKCSFCPRNMPDFKLYAGEFKHMKLELFTKIINDILEFKGKLKVLRLFYLGEPLLCPDFLTMLEIAIKNNIAERIEISTNASLLNEAIADKILELAKMFSGNLYMRFSIYSVIQEKNYKITKSMISINDIHENIARFQKMCNDRHIDNVFTYAKMLDSFDVETTLFVDYYKNIVDEVEIEKPMNWSGYAEKNLLSDVYSEENIESIKSNRIPKVCAYLFHTMAIQSDGKVVCCCLDWSRQTQIGNVNVESLSDIWNGKAMENLRLLHLAGKKNENPACKNCDKLPCGENYKLDNLDHLSLEEYRRRKNVF